MGNKYPTILVMLLLCFQTFVGKAQLEIGKKAPDISLNTWVENPNYENVSLDGKVIVLDFWFTSCAPCIYTTPHLNDLSSLYKNDNIVFLSVSFEDISKLESFLQKKKMMSMVGADTAKQLINAYNVSAYPKTFVIDDKGILRWQGYPAYLFEENLDAILNKKFYPKVVGDKSQKSKSKEISRKYEINIDINDYSGEEKGSLINQQEISFANSKLNAIIAGLSGISPSRIVTYDTLHYDLHFKIPEEVEFKDARLVALDALIEKLNLEQKSVNKSVEGFKLTITNDSLFIANAIDTTRSYHAKSTSSSRIIWKGKGLEMSDLVKQIENRFNVYIFDETLLDGFFDFEIRIQSFDAARNNLLNKYGMTLTPAVRNLSMVEFLRKD